ncbi:hypothetical protein R1flu_003294 [Riccia fluitans]|uniref:Protein kinase domain-containing protein n=1 Tax=Riccia fluitans TaxID=41844 RepID=A0ABD1YCC3_9MARC
MASGVAEASEAIIRSDSMNHTRSSTTSMGTRWRFCHLRLAFLFFCLLQLTDFWKTDAALSPDEEKVVQVLQEMFNVTNSSDLCTTDWLWCTETTPQHVLILWLGGKNTSGNIPSDISKFQYMEEMYLDNNRLDGTIPKWLESMTNITRIRLDNNLLVGTLPDLSVLVNLRYFNASRNGLVGPLPDVTSLKNLQSLYVADNFLNGTIPASVFKSSLLTELYIGNNSWSAASLPDLSQLTNLWSISARLCNFQGPIPSLENNTQLDTIDLSRNQLTGMVPESLAKLTVLDSLDLSSNQLTGMVPESLAELTYLRTLNLSSNRLTGLVPESLAKLTKLRQLDLSSNQLTGMLPENLTKLTNLQTLNIRNNVIQGNLPQLPQQTFELTNIDFSSNNFSGEIPKTWFGLLALQDLNLAANSFQGPLPQDLRKLRSLIRLNLSNNQFSGDIPDLRDLADLRTLDLSNNRLTGKSGMIPEFLVNLSSLQTLNLTNNKFETIPKALANKKGLLVLVDKDVKTQGDSGSGLSTGAIAAIVSSICAAGAILLIGLFIRRRRNKLKDQLSRGDMPKSATAFSLKEIKVMTQAYKKVIGKGGFGPVYYGKLPNGKEVAVKVRATDSKQGAKEFLNEVRLLSRLHHRTLVPLIGYCLDGLEQILVYSYMSQGTLHDHLHRLKESTSIQAETDKSCSRKPLNWKTRLEICLNAARGLEYLHKDCNPPVIHRDVKSSNILLTEKLEAKLGDLGISKQTFEPGAEDTPELTGISTAVQGTLGYMDPEYLVRQRLSTKSDVFSFGIILLEIITGKRAQTLQFPDSDASNLKQWVEQAVSENNLRSVVDPVLREDYAEEGMEMVAETALSCLVFDGKGRPEMGSIVQVLLEALKLEETLENASKVREDVDESTVPLSGRLSNPPRTETSNFSPRSTSGTSRSTILADQTLLDS